MININSKLAFVVPAAGVGARMKSTTPKQYITLQNKTVLAHTINKLQRSLPGAKIIVAVSNTDDYFDTFHFEPNVIRVEGGKERADSVLNALTYLNDHDPVDWVLVHDAARPLILVDEIHQLVTQCLSLRCGGILATKVKDTIKQGDNCVEKTIARERLWQAQTPQMFPLSELLHALNSALKAGVSVTDEASAIERIGGKVALVEGRADNFKLTTPDDIAIADFLIAKQIMEQE